MESSPGPPKPRAERPRAASSHRKPQALGTPSLQGAAPTDSRLCEGPRGQQAAVKGGGVHCGARGRAQKAGAARSAPGPTHFRLSELRQLWQLRVLAVSPEAVGRACVVSGFEALRRW